MPTPDRQQYLHQVLRTDQTPSNKLKYLEPSRLFVDEDDDTEIEAIAPHHNFNQGIDRDDDESDPSSASSKILIPPTDSLLGTHKNNGDLIGYHNLTLRSTRDIDIFCAEQRQGCTIIHIGQVEHSRSELKISRPCFEHMLERMDVFPALKDSILHMGNRSAEVEVAPPSLRTAQFFDTCGPGAGPHGHEVSYGLRYIQPNGRSTGKPWSLRQFFVYNKSYLAKDSSKWIVFSLPEVLRTHVDDYLQVVQADAALNPLDIHVMLCIAVIKMWRPYLVDLTEQIEIYRRSVEVLDLADEGSLRKIETGMLGTLKGFELDLLDAQLALRATTDTLRRIKILSESVLSLQNDTTHAKNKHTENIIDSSMSDGLLDLQMLIEQVTLLSQKVQSMSALRANFLDLASSHCLQELSRNQAIENEEMKKLTTIATRDTKAVKALSIITLVYLPITVVLNFFSTSFFSVDDGKGQVVGSWWLLFAISMPLTALTIFIWIVCVLLNKGNDSRDSPSDLGKFGAALCGEASPDTPSETKN